MDPCGTPPCPPGGRTKKYWISVTWTGLCSCSPAAATHLRAIPAGGSTTGPDTSGHTGCQNPAGPRSGLRPRAVENVVADEGQNQVAVRSRGQKTRSKTQRKKVFVGFYLHIDMVLLQVESINQSCLLIKLGEPSHFGLFLSLYFYFGNVFLRVHVATIKMEPWRTSVTPSSVRFPLI